MQRAPCLVIAVAALLGSLCIAAWADHTEPQKVNRELEGWMVGNFTLLDQNGSHFTQERLDGHWTFVLFGDTGCADSCKAALIALAGMCHRIARTEVFKITQVLYVSLDPGQDSPRRLQRYLAAFDPHFIGASGTRETLERLVRDLSPSGRQSEPNERAGTLLLIGPDRYVRGEFLPPYDVAMLTAKFLKIRIGRY